MHTSPGKLLAEHRLQNARQNLISSSYSLQDIAKLSGYCDEFAFSKAFRQCFGISPSEYRKKNFRNWFPGNIPNFVKSSYHRTANGKDKKYLTFVQIYGILSFIGTLCRRVVLHSWFQQMPGNRPSKEYLRKVVINEMPRKDCVHRSCRASSDMATGSWSGLRASLEDVRFFILRNIFQFFFNWDTKCPSTGVIFSENCVI